MSKRYLTLDIGASSVKLAEYEGGKGGLTLVNYGIAALAAPLDSGNADAILSPAILEIVREKGIKPGPVSVSISGQMVFPRFASIAAAGGSDKFDQQVRFEIEQNIPFPIDEMVCDRQVLGDNENGEKSVMIVAAKTDQVEEITSAVRAAGSYLLTVSDGAASTPVNYRFTLTEQ
jgi:type IV pilus assembly protein PilM